MMMNTATTPQDKKIAPEKLASNDNIVYQSKVFTSIVFGVVAGMFGLTGVNGFAFYVLSSILTSIMLLTTLPRFSSKSIFQSWTSIWLGGFIQALMTFILFWTLAYDSVYIFQ
jgi:predicted acyltransferase